MSATQKVCIVTGSNKGIGFGIVKDLCKKFSGIVYLTSRDEERGTASMEQLKKEGLSLHYHQLDISDETSIKNFVVYLKEKYGSVDVIVNNAAIAYKVSSTASFAEQAENTLKVNYFDTKRFCDLIFPLLRPHGRVVNVSSSSGHLQRIAGDEPAAAQLRSRFASASLTTHKLDELMNEFIAATKAGDWRAKGWASSTYAVSKVGLSALTKLQQKAFDADQRLDLVVNSCHPGYVNTDMTSHKGHFTIERGAECPVYLALLPTGQTDLKGAYLWHDKMAVQWDSDVAPPVY